ncbi:hypothetical protein TIFTF001_043653 [Ficus carica]|nr:hypothetical protein TIFTF001_043653 [Ficus carica]
MRTMRRVKGGVG